MFSRFFIDRPIFAGVISILVMIGGGISIPFLPIEQTPDITPPTVAVTTTYPGANAEVIAETVAQPIEAEVNGVEDMLYMASKCGNDGSYELTVTFKVGTDVDMANVLVQNRVAIAQPKLPEEVKREGVKTEKQSSRDRVDGQSHLRNRAHGRRARVVARCDSDADPGIRDQEAGAEAAHN